MVLDKGRVMGTNIFTVAGIDYTLSECGNLIDDDGITLSLENIKHRFNDKFVEELLVEFKRIKDSNDPEFVYEKGDTSRLVKEYIGINLACSWQEGIENAWVPYDSFSITADAVLSPQWFYGFDENGKRITKGKALANLSVNRSTGYITGAEKAEHLIAMGSILFEDRYTAGEALAIFLHELGHIWNYYVTLPYVMSTNFMLSDFTESFMGVESEEHKIKLLKAAGRDLGIDFDKEREEMLLASRDGDTVAMILLTEEYSRLKSDLGRNAYDLRNFEAMADQFVVRMGMGAELASAIHKLTINGINRENSFSRMAFRIFEAIQGILGLPLYILGWIFAPNIVLEELYDSPIRRIEVVAQGLRDRYKKATDKKEKQALRNQIKSVEDSIKNFDDVSNFYEYMFKYLIPWGRSRSRRITFQKALEDLANSKLTTRIDSIREL